MKNKRKLDQSKRQKKNMVDVDVFFSIFFDVMSIISFCYIIYVSVSVSWSLMFSFFVSWQSLLLFSYFSYPSHLCDVFGGIKDNKRDQKTDILDRRQSLEIDILIIWSLLSPMMMFHRRQTLPMEFKTEMSWVFFSLAPDREMWVRRENKRRCELSTSLIFIVSVILVWWTNLSSSDVAGYALNINVF